MTATRGELPRASALLSRWLLLWSMPAWVVRLPLLVLASAGFLVATPAVAAPGVSAAPTVASNTEGLSAHADASRPAIARPLRVPHVRAHARRLGAPARAQRSEHARAVQLRQSPRGRHIIDAGIGAATAGTVKGGSAVVKKVVQKAAPKAARALAKIRSLDSEEAFKKQYKALGENATRALPASKYVGNGFAQGQLDKHFAKHAAEWGAGNIGKAGYLKRAQNLLGRDAGGDVLGHVRANGDVLRYNAATNEFAAGAADGTIRTLFRPSEGMAYWLKQVTP